MPGARIHRSRRLKRSQPVQSGAKKRRCETVAAIGVSGALGDDKDEACANDWQPMIPDRHGNNRLDRLKTSSRTPRGADLLRQTGERNLPRQRHAHVSADPSLGRRFAVDGKDLATVIVSCGGAGVPTLPPRHSSDPI
jgi:hypothetical protein